MQHSHLYASTQFNSLLPSTGLNAISSNLHTTKVSPRVDLVTSLSSLRAQTLHLRTLHQPVALRHMHLLLRLLSHSSSSSSSSSSSLSPHLSSEARRRHQNSPLRELEGIMRIQSSSFQLLNTLLLLEDWFPQVLLIARNDVLLFPVFLPFKSLLNMIVVAVAPVEIEDDPDVFFGSFVQRFEGIRLLRGSRVIHRSLQNVVRVCLVLHDVGNSVH